jgi:hypothetical protein
MDAHAVTEAPALLGFSLDDTFAAAPGVRVVALGDRTALFDAERQQIAELNETAALIWSGLAEGRAPNAIIASLTERGAPPASAHDFVAAALEQWLVSGALAPTALLAERPPLACQRLSIDGFRADLSFYGEAPQETQRVFAHFAGATGEAALQLSVHRRDGRDFILRDRTPLGMFAPETTAPQLKALLTEAYCDSVEDGFLAHGALVSLGGKRIFIGGEPGAGKTTLTLALAAAGAGYCGDDIVHVHSDGRVSGAPFAAAAKTGTWPILAPRLPRLMDLPLHLRADGQPARYVIPAVDENAPRPLDLVVFVSRSGAETHLEKLDPLNALCRLIDASYARGGELSAEAFDALAQRFAAICCYQLEAGDLDASLQTMHTIVHE